MVRQWLLAFLYLAAVLGIVRVIDTHHRRRLDPLPLHVQKKPPLPLRFGADGSFKILQVADLHFGSGATTRCRDVEPRSRSGCSDLNSTRFLRRLIAAERPDFIAFTGDNVFGSSSADVAESLFAAFAPAAEARIPWAAVLGNHDHEGSSLSRQEIIFLASLMDYSVSRVFPQDYADPIHGFGNYKLRVEYNNNTTTAAPVMELIFLDSGHRATVDGRRTYGWIQDSQLRWLLSDPGNAPHRLAFFHIPIPEMRRHFHVGNVLGGSFQEGVACSAVDSGVLRSLQSLGGVRAAFFGHDHLNDFCGSLAGIWFCYGGGFGYHGYGRRGWARRGRLIHALLDPTRTRLQSLRTWKRLDDPLLSPLDHLVLWEEN